MHIKNNNSGIFFLFCLVSFNDCDDKRVCLESPDPPPGREAGNEIIVMRTVAHCSAKK